MAEGKLGFASAALSIIFLSGAHSITSLFATLNCCSVDVCSGAGDPHLLILPEGAQTIRAGKNVVLTCRAQVPNTELVRNLKWIDPEGNEVSQDSRSGSYLTSNLPIYVLCQKPRL